MKQGEKAVSWVVYKMTSCEEPPEPADSCGRRGFDAMVAASVYKESLGIPQGANAVCEQAEWDAMQLAKPGRHTLLREGIPSEAEAERVARESEGGTEPGKVSLRRRL